MMQDLALPPFIACSALARVMLRSVSVGVGWTHSTTTTDSDTTTTTTTT
eukprot:CAMPEP_0175174348 /NCGR_PEP_ID=MMETSP0087-20121206/32581_1 /TAXON_ID=136419 /ORGANISM="Unknown Unknown, Strain D1" /LENGTH=48 /DNA_ID= /DNA_START= /DNA_END= /DNA_ORIENTATION=